MGAKRTFSRSSRTSLIRDWRPRRFRGRPCCPVADLHAGGAHPAGLRGGPLLAIERLGQDAGGGGLPHPARAGEQVGVGDAPRGEGVGEHLHRWSCPTMSAKTWGRYLRARTVYDIRASAPRAPRPGGVKKGRAPAVDRPVARSPGIRLRPGAPAAPRGDCLPLLPSGPDGVHKPRARRTWPSTPSHREPSLTMKASDGASAPL